MWRVWGQDLLWWWFHSIEESHPSVSVSSFGILHQVSVTSSFYYSENCFTGFLHVRSKYCSLAKSGRLICIARSWEFCFAMITSVRAKRFTGSSGKTSLDLSKCFSRVGCWAYGGWLCSYMTQVAAEKLPLIVTSCIISCVKPHYFHSAFHSVFLHFGFHSCPPNGTLN